ncbi:hypothetical protein Bbelb_165730 [Branchiostoma belcheri]|nr:hypothetical protein Bbelb_165730 [Branchiostoma belcheri]
MVGCQAAFSHLDVVSSAVRLADVLVAVKLVTECTNRGEQGRKLTVHVVISTPVQRHSNLRRSSGTLKQNEFNTKLAHTDPPTRVLVSLSCWRLLLAAGCLSDKPSLHGGNSHWFLIR